MTIEKLKYQAIALDKVIKSGNCKNKHAVASKINQIKQRIRERERFNNNQNWLGQ